MQLSNRKHALTYPRPQFVTGKTDEELVTYVQLLLRCCVSALAQPPGAKHFANGVPVVSGKARLPCHAHVSWTPRREAAAFVLPALAAWLRARSSSCSRATSRRS